MYVKWIFSGGDRSFAYATPNSNDGYDSRIYEYDSIYLLNINDLIWKPRMV